MLSGSSVLFQFSSGERQVFYKSLSHECPALQVDLLQELLGDKFLPFIDALNGQTLKIPTLLRMFRLYKDAKIYTYCKSHNFSDESFKRAGFVYHKSSKACVSLCKRYAEFLGDNFPEIIEQKENE